MNSHFQSSETTSTLRAGTLDLSGLAGSRSWLPIQAIPPSSMTVSAGIAHTTISIAPEYSQSGRYSALLLPRRNHQAKAIVAIMVGMMIASMIAVELIMICFSAAPTGPIGSRMPRLQELRTNAEAASDVEPSLARQPCRRDPVMVPPTG